MALAHFWQQIPGWFDWMDTYARWVREVPDDGVIVEVGSFKGRSAAFLGVEAINSGKRLRLHCVDTWQGSPELMQLPEVRDGSFYHEFVTNLQPVLQHHDTAPMRLFIHRKPSVVAAEQFADGSVDRVWLDGDHSTAGLLADLEAWWPKLAPGGELGGHDFGFFGVTPAVEQFAQRRGLPIQVLDPCPAAGTENVSQSFLLRKARPVSDWAVPEGLRSVQVTVACNHPFVPRQTVASLGPLLLHAREQAAALGFEVDIHWEAEAFCLDTLRDRAAYRALCEGHSHVLWLDADNVWPHGLLGRLLPHHEKGIVGGLYHLKTPPHQPVALRKAADDPDPNMYTHLTHVHEERALVEVDVLGMGCTLVPTAVFRQLERPWFQFQADAAGWMRVTEDIWFCQRAKQEAGCRLWVDPTLNIGHVAHSVVGVRNYEEFLPAVEKAQREKRRRALEAAAQQQGAA
jgi:hypothetical protein